jgi:hypothetical protein
MSAPLSNATSFTALSNPEIMMTLMSGYLFFKRGIKSTPNPSGSLLSRITTAGLSDSKYDSAADRFLTCRLFRFSDEELIKRHTYAIHAGYESGAFRLNQSSVCETAESINTHPIMSKRPTM